MVERDEEGEFLYDPDEQSSSREMSPQALEQREEGGGAGFYERSPSSAPRRPEYDDDDEEAPKSKSRKRLVKKSGTREAHSPEEQERRHRQEEEEEEEEEEAEGYVSSPVVRRKSKDREEGEIRKRVKKAKDTPVTGKKRKSAIGSSSSDKLARNTKGGVRNKGSDWEGSEFSTKKGAKEMKEMWDSVAGNGDDSEEDREGVPDDEDKNFIDDEGVPENERYISDGEQNSAGDAPQAEEAGEDDQDDDELTKFFKGGKKRKKFEHTPEEIAMFVEQFMAKLDVAAETDADLNCASKPAIEKLKMLPELMHVLEKRQLQQEFLDRGVLSSLKNWLEPLPDGSLPNINIRTGILKLLTDLPIDVEVYERREQLKKSGLGKVVMFLSRLPEETPINKKLARDLVDKWSRPLFQKSTRYEDLRSYDEERPQPQRTPLKKPASRPRLMDSRPGDELDMLHESEELRPGDVGYRQHASRPEALPLDFVRRPESKVDPEVARNRARQQRQDERRMKMNKKLQHLKTTKKSLQASRISVEGRGVVHF
ncbi:hypothetical protein BDL97_17G061700 [Sphagnum fallax]|nr:hypothetical protein BDL97_17G061700 [Sphagnum fallax]KAH8936020.1 hypothetical protein BDL97_17G061700 [Sphagnum fallax]